MMFLLTVEDITEHRWRSPDIPGTLMERLKTQEESAFAEFYELTKTAVYGFALSILKNRHDAEDVMQETFVKVYHGIASYECRDKPMAWVLRITRNTALNHLRSRARFASSDREDLPDAEEAVAFDAPEDRILLAEALKSLEESERQAIILHAVSGLRHREVAALMELPLSTVLSKYHRALRKLRDIMQEEE